MCKICELKKRCDKLKEEIEFRMLQYQKENSYGRPQAAGEAKVSAKRALNDIFDELDKIPALIAEIEGAELNIDSLVDSLMKKARTKH